MKTYVVGGKMFVDRSYTNWLPGEEVGNLKEADLVLFAGGSDVDPKLYKEPCHCRTEFKSCRDKFEVEIFKSAIKMKKPLLGICRGAQFLCVMAGGKLVQHQKNPWFWHYVTTHDTKGLLTTSTHHQAQYPWGLQKKDYKILGWTNHISPFHLGGRNEEMVRGIVKENTEVEITCYPKINALCIQGHPELMMDSLDHIEVKNSLAYYNKLVEKLMDKSLFENE